MSNERQGWGVQKWTDGAIYEGFWKGDAANGKGRFIDSCGDVYEVAWVNGRSHGHGRYTHYNGSTFDGEWVRDK
jgi:hypothetical protein